jgi:HEXXH motif-containing protein
MHASFETRTALRNGDEPHVPSPIRPDPRPLIGVFHAMFVFLRLSQFMERVMQVEPSFDAETRLHRHLLGLYSGVAQVERFADLTPLGIEFYASVKAEAKRMQVTLPKPQPALYDAIAFDYERPCDLPAATMD